LIIAIGEGTGEELALPVLIDKILKHQGVDTIGVADVALQTKGKPNMTRSGGLERFIRDANLESAYKGILVLLDGDTECPVTVAQELAGRVQIMERRCPVVIVVANKNYETWFYASVETICTHEDLPDGLTYSQDCETMPNVTTWLTNQMHVKEAFKKYKKTRHQLEFTEKLDVSTALSRSRSFRRLYNAVAQLVQAIDAQTNTVTPL
jgi:hypothetical protein